MFGMWFMTIIMTIIMAFGWHIRAAYGHQGPVGFIVLRHSFLRWLWCMGQWRITDSIICWKLTCRIYYIAIDQQAQKPTSSLYVSIQVSMASTGTLFANSNETGTHCFGRHPFLLTSIIQVSIASTGTPFDNINYTCTHCINRNPVC